MNPTEMFPALEATALSVARRWLTLESTSIGAITIDHADIRTITDHRMTTLAIKLIEDGQVEASDSVVDTLHDRALVAAQRAVALESLCAAVVEALAAAGVESRVLKGIAVAQLDYAQSSQRLTSDVDLLVRSADFRVALDLIRSHGFHRHFDEPFDGFDSTIGKGAALEGPGQHVVDLHRSLALGYYGTRLPVDALWSDPISFPLAGIQASALPVAARFAHAALHLGLAPSPRAMHFLDLPVIVAADDDTLQEQIITVATQWRCGDVIARAVLAANQIFPSWHPDRLLHWAASRHTTPTEQLWWSTYHGRFATTASRSAAAIAGIRPRRVQPAAAVRLLASRARLRR